MVMMALRKEPERRYASAEQLAEDIERYLNRRPVIAQKDTLGYRVHKFVRRNRTGVAVAAGGFLLVLGFGVVMATQAVRIAGQAEEIAQERDRAQLEAEKALQVAGFLEDLFKSPDPYAATPDRRDTLRVRDFLAQGAVRVREELEAQPAVRAQLLDVLGGVYRNLGQLKEARPLMEQALKIRSEGRDAELGEVAGSLNDLAYLLVDMGDHEKADSLFREALRRGELGDDRFSMFTALEGLGNLMQDRGEFDEAETLYREAVRLSHELLDYDHQEVAVSMMSLATVLTRKAEYGAAEPLMREALEIQRKVFGPEHPLVVTSLNNLAFLLDEKGELDEAEEMHREGLAISRKRFDPPHPRVARSLNNLASVLQQKGDLDAAEPYFRESLAMRRQLYGNDHPAVAIGLSNLAFVVQNNGNPGEAERMFRESLGILGTLIGRQHPSFAAVTGNLANVMHVQGDHEGAEAQYRVALAIRRNKLPPGHPSTARTMMDLGRCLTDLEKYEEAESLLLESFDTLAEDRDEQTSAWDGVLQRLTALYTAWGKPEQAARYEAALFEPA
jgi:serine/threonine-protein kinase